MNADVVVIGAGIVGAACARALAREHLSVLVVESRAVGGGATGAGMGHLTVMDDSEAQFALTRWSRELWLQIAPELPGDVEFRQCGTIWVASDEEEFAAVRRKHDWYERRGVRAEVLDSACLAEAEPKLRPELAGGLLVPDDAVIYAPCAARWLLESSGAVSRVAPIIRVDASGVVLAGGERIAAGVVVCATGCSAPELFPGLEVRPRKGHLVITDRYPDFVHHQLIELGYLKSAHGVASESVAFNVQPRATGQLLVGSSRQFGEDTAAIEWPLLERMIRRAIEFMPALAKLSVIRAWTGFRAATPDKLPLIGRHERLDNVMLATGHEGLGITMALATAELVAAMILRRESAIPAAPYLPSRFAQVSARA